MIDQANVVVTSVTSAPGTLVLALSGELDLANVDACHADLRAMIDHHLRREPSAGSGEPMLARVVLDLSGLTFLAVAGLRMLTALAASLQRHHITVVAAVGSTGLIGRLVHLAGLDQQMQIVAAPYRSASGGAPTAVRVNAPTTTPAIRLEGATRKRTSRPGDVVRLPRT